MATLESWMPNDLDIANRYIEKARTLRGVLAESGSESLVSLADSLTRATVQFGRCELHMHAADRNAALNINAALISSGIKRAMSYHARGLEYLAGAKPALTRLAEEASSIAEEEVRKIWSGIEGEIKESWLSALGDLDMKPSDAQKLLGVMDECSAAAATGFKGLVGHIDQQFQKLEQLRKTPTRGTENNWPVWKLAAVAVWLGMTVAGVIMALQRGAAWWDIGMIILIGLIGILLIAFGC